MFNKINELYDRLQKIELGGGSEKIAAQHRRGKYTARERIDLLLDSGSFVELNPWTKHRSPHVGLDKTDALGDGVVTGYGTINERSVYVFAHDFTVLGGSLGEMHAKRIANLMDIAAKNGAPIIGLYDSGGARIQEGVAALNGYGEIFYRNVLYSGVVPQLSVIMGPCAGGAVYSPALTDIVIMVEKTSQMFITGPKVIEAVTGEIISAEVLGGAHIHNSNSGNAHFKVKNEEDALQLVKELLRYLPNNFEEKPLTYPYVEDDHHYREQLIDVVPIDTTRPYDMKSVIELIVDQNSFIEFQQDFAKNMIIGFARINGMGIGLVCNQPRFLAGGIDIDSSDKAARFIRFCDAFQIPIVTVEDVTGFLPGIAQEHAGLIRHGAKLLYAYAEATVPKITVIIRKAYGGAYVALNSKGIGADIVYAWPNAEIAVMGPEGAVNIMFAKEIANSTNPNKTKLEKMNEFKKQFTSPYMAAQLGYVDDVIDPRETRIKLIQALTMFQNKKIALPEKKHGNMPL